jgi:subtilisin family serine protease
MKTYSQKCKEFVKDKFTLPFRNGKSKNYNTWKVSWGHIDMEIWRVWKEYDTMGEGVKVAVLDTGVCDTENDLYGRVNHDLSASIVGNGLLDGTSSHGTFSAGVVGAGGHHIKNVFGVAPKCELIIYKVSKGAFYVPDVVRALEKAMEADVKIISMSFSVDSDDEIKKHLRTCMEKGIILVAAIGNAGKNESKFPASAPECISVGAYQIDDEHGDLTERIINPVTNRHHTLCVLCPGKNILTTSPNASVAFHQNTSGATAFMAGLIALVVAAVTKEGISVTQPLLMEAFAHDGVCEHIAAGSEKRTENEGFGIINPLKLISYLKNYN